MTTPAFRFGQRVKRAILGGNATELLGQGWNNSARAFKGMTGGIAGALGAAGGGLAAGGMQAANAVGGLVGKQPFSNEAIDTAYGAADHYADIGSAYGKDFATSMGLGRQGLAGTTQNYSAGDAHWNKLEQQPGVSTFAKDMSQRGRNVLNTTANIAPAAAIGTGAKMLHAGAAAAAPGSVAARVGSATAPVMNTASKLTSGSNSLGIGGKVLYNAAAPIAKLNK